MWTESSSICKFGEYICYKSRDIEFFIGVTFLVHPVVATNNGACIETECAGLTSLS